MIEADRTSKNGQTKEDVIGKSIRLGAIDAIGVGIAVFFLFPPIFQLGHLRAHYCDKRSFLSLSSRHVGTRVYRVGCIRS